MNEGKKKINIQKNYATDSVNTYTIRAANEQCMNSNHFLLNAHKSKCILFMFSCTATNDLRVINSECIVLLQASGNTVSHG